MIKILKTVANEMRHSAMGNSCRSDDGPFRPLFIGILGKTICTSGLPIVAGNVDDIVVLFTNFFGSVTNIFK